MINEILHRMLSNPNEFDFQEIYDSEGILFDVDWREDDVDIANYCESILNTKSLSSHYRLEEGEEVPKLFITYEGKSHEVPLIIGPEDRHITLFSLNEILKPDFEIRLLVASARDCTLGFLPLKRESWDELENKYADSLDSCFAKIAESPILFTLGFGYTHSVTWQELAKEKNEKAKAIKLYKKVNECGLMEAKKAVESFISDN